MTEKYTKGEMHGCIVCGKLYQLYVVNDASGKYVDAKVMSAGGKLVPYEVRPLVACEQHSDAEIESAVVRAYGKQAEEDDD
jgi:hypothetical protein